ncbi:hypothetical protein FRB95_012927 [Tulasnella sp. JGI-2019a]|nr:hypothetical protein FRB95_012927 [Tulasnella sp. JGI-2019a]
MALPTYKVILNAWCKMGIKYLNLKHAINFGLSKIEEYVQKARKSKIYTLALVLNPHDKLRWIEDHWQEPAISGAEETVQGVHGSDSAYVTLASWATISQASALSKLQSINLELVDDDDNEFTFSTPTSITQPTRSEAELVDEDQRIVMAELSAYLADTSVQEADTTVQILSYWRIRILACLRCCH